MKTTSICGARAGIVLAVNSGVARLLIGGIFWILACSGEAGTAILDTNFNFSSSFDRDVTTIQQIVSIGNGKFLARGIFGVGGQNRATAFRFHTDGSWDTGFSIGQIVGGGPTDLLVLTNSNILIAGSIASISGIQVPGIARLNSDGAFDSSFHRFYSGSLHATGVRLLSDDRIVLFGDFSILTDGQLREGILLLHANGSLDSTFNISFTGVPNLKHAIVQADNKIIIFGNFTGVQGFAKKWLARIGHNGQLDLSYTPPQFDSGTPGVETAPAIQGMSLQSDGKTLLWGNISIQGVKYQAVRLNVDGTFDNTFSPPLLSSDVLPTQQSLVGKIVVTDANKLLLAGGFTHVDGVRRPSLIRLFQDGSLDEEFATNMENLFSLTNPTSITDLSLEGNGRILLNGKFWLSDTNSQPMIRLEVGAAIPTNSLAIALYPGISITGNIGQSYRIEYQSEAGDANWSLLTNVTLTVSPYLFFDTASPRPAQRYYRSVATTGQ